MPALLPYPTHRLHLTVSEEDHLWLKEQLGPDETISDLFRQLIRRLRGEASRSPRKSMIEVLEGMEGIERREGQ